MQKIDQKYVYNMVPTYSGQTDAYTSQGSAGWFWWAVTVLPRGRRVEEAAQIWTWATQFLELPARKTCKLQVVMHRTCSKHSCLSNYLIKPHWDFIFIVKMLFLYNFKGKTLLRHRYVFTVNAYCTSLGAREVASLPKVFSATWSWPSRISCLLSSTTKAYTETIIPEWNFQ